MERIAVGVVDDHPSISLGLSVFFSKSSDQAYVAWSFGEIEDALKAIKEQLVDVLIVDLRIANENGFELLAKIKNVPKVVYSAYYTEIYVRRAFDLGASAFIQKDEPLEKLLEAVVMASKGQSLLSESDLAHQKAVFKKELSKRELEVIRLINEGKSNSEIAEHLNIRENTVKSYLRRIFFKLDAHSRQHAAHQAIEKGLILPK